MAARAHYVGSMGTKSGFFFPHSGDGVFCRNSAIRLDDISDGSSATLLVGEHSTKLSNATWVGGVGGQNCTPPGWPNPLCLANVFSLILSRTGPSPANPSLGVPADPRVQPPNAPDAGPDGYWSLHPGGADFLFCDGTVRFVKSTISWQAFSSLATRAGGEAIGSDAW